jgi:hypothetical protein
MLDPKHFCLIRSTPNEVLCHVTVNQTAPLPLYVDLQLRFETGPIDALLELTHFLML